MHDTILYNGVVRTIDREDSIREAIGIKDKECATWKRSFAPLRMTTQLSY